MSSGIDFMYVCPLSKTFGSTTDLTPRCLSLNSELQIISDTNNNAEGWTLLVMSPLGFKARMGSLKDSHLAEVDKD